MKAVALVVHRPGTTGGVVPEPFPGLGSPLQLTLQRTSRIAGVERILVLHTPEETCAFQAWGTPIETFAHPDVAGDAYSQRLRIARLWAGRAWRGGLGGATVWDELLPASAWAAAMQHVDADAAVILGSDWCAMDPELSSRLLARFVEAGDTMRLTFSQAPPGLGPIILSRATVEDLAAKHATLGAALAYNPRHPAIDPIGREVCLPIPAAVRDTARRFIADDLFHSHASAAGVRGGAALLAALATALGPAFATADMEEIVGAAADLEAADPADAWETLPREIVIELTPQRLASGPIVPQVQLDLDRGPMARELAERILSQCAGRLVTFGGLGDAALHSDLPALTTFAQQSRVASLHVVTDLLGDAAASAALLDLPLDILSVRLNADTPETYARVMGVDAFAHVMENLQACFDARGRRTGQKPTLNKRGLPGAIPGAIPADVPGDIPGAIPPGGGAGVPWILPRLTKVADNLGDLENFFERWMQIVGHAVIDRFPTGGRGRGALVADQSPVPMEPPPRPPRALQVKERLTILSDGRVVLCSQDWLGRAALGHVDEMPLRDLWQQRGPTVLRHHDLAHGPVCRRCADWWSLRRAPTSV